MDSIGVSIGMAVNMIVLHSSSDFSRQHVQQNTTLEGRCTRQPGPAPCRAQAEPKTNAEQLPATCLNANQVTLERDALQLRQNMRTGTGKYALLSAGR